MKKLFALSAIVLSVTIACGQADKSKRPSPPAVEKETLSGGATVTIDYSQPSVKGRAIGKDIAPYGKVWRTGANQITSIKFGEDLLVNGKTLKAGSYGLYTVPGEKTWKIIFNSDDKQWGAYAYDPAKDVYSF